MPFPALACMLHVLPIPSLIIFGDENELWTFLFFYFIFVAHKMYA
jgi:hypothetical protein